MVVLISTYLLLVFMVPVLVSAFVSIRALPHTSACPSCAGDTALLRARGGPLGRALLRRLRLERRWCYECGWTGLARRRLRAWPMPATGTERDRSGLRVLDVRSLRVDGRTWRVQLQCWEDTHFCHGRLIFVDGSGRPWPDALQAFSARTQLEILGQALSIPDRALATRLRQLITAD